MLFEELIAKNRSFRRFRQSRSIDEAKLRQLVDYARLSPSATNRQALKFVLSWDPNTNEKVFPCLGWAGYLSDWPGPAEGERPSAYIIILGDTSIASSFGCDHGIAAQSILLGAVDSGLGGCMIGSINRSDLQNVLGIPSRYEILLVIALGEPAEQVVVEPMGDHDTRYYRDENDIHHVPKRSLDELIVPL